MFMTEVFEFYSEWLGDCIEYWFNLYHFEACDEKVVTHHYNPAE